MMKAQGRDRPCEWCARPSLPRCGVAVIWWPTRRREGYARKAEYSCSSDLKSLFSPQTWRKPSKSLQARCLYWAEQCGGNTIRQPSSHILPQLCLGSPPSIFGASGPSGCQYVSPYHRFSHKRDDTRALNQGFPGNSNPNLYAKRSLVFQEKLCCTWRFGYE